MPSTEGKLSHIGLAGEKVFGTAVGATDYLKFSSESMTNTIEDLIEASLNARREEGDSFEGMTTIAGDTVHEVHPTNLGYFLRSFFGHPDTTAHSATSYTHVFNPESILVSARKGTATSSTATTLVDSGQSWTVDAYIGKYVLIVGGTGRGQSRYITDNDATSVTVATWVINPDTTSVYEIRLGPKDCTSNPPYTLEIDRNFSGATAAYQYTGCVVNAMAFAIGGGTKILNLTNSWLGKDVSSIASTSPSLPSTLPFKWNQMKFGFDRATTATVDAGSTTTNIAFKGAPGWTVNQYVGDIVFIKTGTGINQARTITANAAAALTVGTLVTAPAEDDTVEIFSAFDYAEDIAWTFDNGLTTVPLLNNTSTVGKIEPDGDRIGTLTGTFEDSDPTNYDRFTGRTQVRGCLFFEGATISGGHKQRLFIDMPYLLIDAYPHNIGGGGRVTISVSAKMKYDSTDSRAFRVILDNNKANYNL